MNRSTRLRPPLFDVRGTTWSELNQTALVRDAASFHALLGVLRKNGYIVTKEAVVAPDMVSVTLVDHDGKNNGRAGGFNEWITVYWWVKSLPDRISNRPGLSMNGDAYLTTNLSKAQSMNRSQLVWGFELEHAAAIDAYMYRFVFSRANPYNPRNPSEQVLYFWGTPGPSELMFEIVWRDSDREKWQLWNPYPGRCRTAWYGQTEPEKHQLDCQNAHPGAEVVIRPTLFPS